MEAEELWKKLFGNDKNTTLDSAQARMLSQHLRHGAKSLIEMSESYRKATDFNPGQLVRWKTHMKNMRWPMYGQPAVVMGVAPGQISSENDSGSNSWKAPQDLSIGLWNAEGEFQTWWVDSHRFELVPNDELELMDHSIQHMLNEHEQELAQAAAKEDQSLNG